MSLVKTVTTFKKLQEIDDSSPFLRTPDQLLVGVAPGIGMFDDSLHPSLQRCRVAFLGDHAGQATALQKLSGGLQP